MATLQSAPVYYSRTSNSRGSARSSPRQVMPFPSSNGKDSLMVDTWMSNMKQPTALPMAVKQDEASGDQDDRIAESLPAEPTYRPASTPADDAPCTSYDVASSMTLLQKFSVHPTTSRRLQGFTDVAWMILALIPTAVFRLIRAAMGLVGVTEHRWRGISMVLPLTLDDRKQLEVLAQNLVAGRLGRRPDPPQRGPVPPSHQLLLDVHAILAAAASTAASFNLPYDGLPEAALQTKLASYLRKVASSGSVCTQDCFKVMRKVARNALRKLCASAPRMPAPLPPPSSSSTSPAAVPQPPSSSSFFGAVRPHSCSSSSTTTTRFMSRPKPRAVASAFNTACLLQQCASSHPDTLIQLVARLPDGTGDLVETVSIIPLAPGAEYLRLLSAAATASARGSGDAAAAAASERFAEQLEAMAQYGRLRPSDAKKDPAVQGMAINARIHEVGIVRYGRQLAALPAPPSAALTVSSKQLTSAPPSGSRDQDHQAAAAVAGGAAGPLAEGKERPSTSSSGSAAAAASASDAVVVPLATTTTTTAVSALPETTKKEKKQKSIGRGSARWVVLKSFEDDDGEVRAAVEGGRGGGAAGGGRSEVVEEGGAVVLTAGRRSEEGERSVSETGSEPDDSVGLLNRMRRHQRTSSQPETPRQGPSPVAATSPTVTSPFAAEAVTALPSAPPSSDITPALAAPPPAAAVTATTATSSLITTAATAATVTTANTSSRTVSLALAPAPSSPFAPKPSAGVSFFIRPLPPGFIAGSGPSTSILHYPTSALDVLDAVYACPRSGAFALHGREPRGVGLSRLVSAYASCHSMPLATQGSFLAELGFRSVEALREEVELRKALCVAQALPVVVASLRLMVGSPACLLAAHRTGCFLHVQQSLLSDLHRHERGYLEDTRGALDVLSERLMVRFVEGSEKVLPLQLTGSTITVSLPSDCVSEEALAAAGLTRKDFCSSKYGLTAVLFNQGINSLQSLGFLTWSEKQGGEPLQDTLNRHSLERFNEYALRANRCNGPELAALNAHYGPAGRRPPKDTAMFGLVRRACHEVGAGRAVNCKSGKDRTALEVSRAMAEEVVAAGVLPPACLGWLQAQFMRGLSYVTTSQNHGQPPAYAFNEVEIATLPAGWRPDWRLCGKVAT